jgi:hypothetical protein
LKDETEKKKKTSIKKLYGQIGILVREKIKDKKKILGHEHGIFLMTNDLFY